LMIKVIFDIVSFPSSLGSIYTQIYGIYQVSFLFRCTD
jgi:hypothetical protein